MHRVIALAVLFITCAIASSASAQSCRQLFHAAPPGVTCESPADAQSRMQEESYRRRAYQYREQSYYGPGNYSGYNSYSYGSWYDGYYQNYRYRVNGRQVAEGYVWEFPYRQFPNGCPSAPPETRAPKGYRWSCERATYGYYAGYTRKGSEDVKDLAVLGLVLGALAFVVN